MRSPATPPRPASSPSRRRSADAVVLREAVAGLLLFGVLAGRADLERAGATALQELAARGYVAIDAAAPVRVHPLEADAGAEANRAGGWRPGTVFLRPEPLGGEPASVYLRHELLHEASFRTCGGRLPLWAEEAAALAFSGATLPLRDPSAEAVDRLRAAVRVDSTLDAENTRTLEALVARHGWPDAPCAESPAIAALVRPQAPVGGALAFVVVSAVSGRVLEASGDTDALAPPGSLLKIPYAAALDVDDPERLGDELARSDTDALLRRRNAFHLDRFARLLAPIGGARLPTALDDEVAWRTLVGERGGDGGYPVESSLVELALVLRAALVATPARFAGLVQNGRLPGSTLATVDVAGRDAVERLHALAKTGTASNARGEPLVGHLMLAWPAERPRYLAVLRKRGIRGAALTLAARDEIVRWRREFTPDAGAVRVRLFTRLDADDVTLREPCPGLDVAGGGAAARTSTCGALVLATDAAGARPERVVRGIVERSDAAWVLVTDPESYADAVLDAEAADLRGEARAALRAVVVWNGIHGAGRHPDAHAVCDTTHCMVFRGLAPSTPAPRDPPVAPALLRQLDDVARTQSEP